MAKRPARPGILDDPEAWERRTRAQLDAAGHESDILKFLRVAAVLDDGRLVIELRSNTRFDLMHLAGESGARVTRFVVGPIPKRNVPAR